MKSSFYKLMNRSDDAKLEQILELIYKVIARDLAYCPIKILWIIGLG